MKPRVEGVGRRNQVNPPNTHPRTTHGLQQRPNRQIPNVRILHSGPRRTGKALRVARLKPMTLQIKTSTSINTLKDTKPNVKSKVWPLILRSLYTPFFHITLEKPNQGSIVSSQGTGRGGTHGWERRFGCNLKENKKAATVIPTPLGVSIDLDPPYTPKCIMLIFTGTPTRDPNLWKP